jgi:hypothetical protein
MGVNLSLTLTSVEAFKSVAESMKKLPVADLVAMMSDDMDKSKVGMVVDMLKTMSTSKHGGGVALVQLFELAREAADPTTILPDHWQSTSLFINMN